MRRVSQILVLGAMLAGCAGAPLHASMTDPEFRAVVEPRFTPGMTRAEVEATLTELEQPSKWRIVREEPPGILQRVWEPGGFWVTDAHDIVEWVDLSFHFDGAWVLERWEMQRQVMRYDNGLPYRWDPADGPPRRWPAAPLPPREWRGGQEGAN